MQPMMCCMKKGARAVSGSRNVGRFEFTVEALKT